MIFLMVDPGYPWSTPSIFGHGDFLDQASLRLPGRKQAGPLTAGSFVPGSAGKRVLQTKTWISMTGMLPDAFFSPSMAGAAGQTSGEFSLDISCEGKNIAGFVGFTFVAWNGLPLLVAPGVTPIWGMTWKQHDMYYGPRILDKMVG